MRFFPIFLRVADHRILVSGGGEEAVAKLRLLLKTEARIEVYADTVDPLIADWAAEGRLRVVHRALQACDMVGARLVYGANDDPVEDARVARLAEAAGVLHNIVDNLDDSAFLTAAMVDRDPLVIAIGTEGAAPVLARKVKAHLEERLPATLGRLRRRPRPSAPPPRRSPRAAPGARSGARSSPTPSPPARRPRRVRSTGFCPSIWARGAAKGPRPVRGRGSRRPRRPDDARPPRARRGGCGDPRPAGAGADPRACAARGRDRRGGQDRLRPLDPAGRDQRDDRGPRASGRGRRAAQGGRSGRLRAARRGDRRLRRGGHRLVHRAGADLGLHGRGAAWPEPDEARPQHRGAAAHRPRTSTALPITTGRRSPGPDRSRRSTWASARRGSFRGGS
jgi:siroheme synthase-like protein